MLERSIATVAAAALGLMSVLVGCSGGAKGSLVSAAAPQERYFMSGKMLLGDEETIGTDFAAEVDPVTANINFVKSGTILRLTKVNAVIKSSGKPDRSYDIRSSAGFREYGSAFAEVIFGLTGPVANGYVVPTIEVVDIRRSLTTSGVQPVKSGVVTSDYGDYTRVFHFDASASLEAAEIHVKIDSQTGGIGLRIVPRGDEAGPPRR